MSVFAERSRASDAGPPHRGEHCEVAGAGVKQMGAASAAPTRPIANQLSGFLRIHKHESDAARLLAVVEPGVIDRLLDDHIARLEMDRAGIEHHVDLA